MIFLHKLRAHNTVADFKQHPIICVDLLLYFSQFLSRKHIRTNHTIINYFTHLMMRRNDKITLSFPVLNDITKITRVAEYDAMKVTSYSCARREREK